MKKIRRWVAVIMVCLLTLTGAEAAGMDVGVKTVQAKTLSSTKKKVQKAYRKFLTKNKYKYYRLWDIDKDGLKELLVTDGKDRVYNAPSGADVYTYTRGKVKYAGYVGHSMSGVSYNRVSKRLHASRGGGGSIEYWYYTLTPNKKIKTVMCGAYVDGVKNGNIHYKCLYKGKRISYKKWDQTTRKWISQTRTLNYYRNTAYNRKNNMKM